MELERAENVKEKIKAYFEALESLLISLDIERVINSTHSQYFRRISSLGRAEEYLNLKVPFYKTKVIPHVRLLGTKNQRLIVGKTIYTFNPKKPCPLCEDSQDIVLHFILNPGMVRWGIQCPRKSV